MFSVSQSFALEDIRQHYDVITPFYRSLWGEHIHHGYWNGDGSAVSPQAELVNQLVLRAGIRSGAHVLDVGCGVGETSLWLAANFDCSVVGITISEVQQEIAARKAGKAGLENRISFEVADANRLTFAPLSFDAVCVIECSEHLLDKRTFVFDCSRLLRPGGVFALCAWLVADQFGSEDEEQLVRQVCSGMLCPSLATMDDYVTWMRESGLADLTAEDVTSEVRRTWVLCSSLARRPEVRFALRSADPPFHRFVKAIGAIDAAYARGAMAYGMFTGRKQVKTA